MDPCLCVCMLPAPQACALQFFGCKSRQGASAAALLSFVCTIGCRSEHGITDGEAGMLSGFGPDAMKPAPKLQRASKSLQTGGQAHVQECVHAFHSRWYTSVQVSSLHHVCLDCFDSCLVNTAQVDVHLPLALYSQPETKLSHSFSRLCRLPQGLMQASVQPRLLRWAWLPAQEYLACVVSVYMSSPGVLTRLPASPVQALPWTPRLSIGPPVKQPTTDVAPSLSVPPPVMPLTSCVFQEHCI